MYKAKVLTEVYNLFDVIKDIMLDNIVGKTYDGAKEFLLNKADPHNGDIRGLIDFKDTEAIAREFYNDIFTMTSIKDKSVIPRRLVSNLNELTLFAFNDARNNDFVNDVLDIAIELRILKRTCIKKYIVLDARYNKIEFKELNVHNEYENPEEITNFEEWMEINDDTEIVGTKILNRKQLNEFKSTK